MNYSSYNTMNNINIHQVPVKMRSSTRGTAQKIVGFNSPMSSTNNFTS